MFSTFTLTFALRFYANVSVAQITTIFMLYQLAFALLIWVLIFECKLYLPTFSNWIPLSVLFLTLMAVYNFASYVGSPVDDLISIFPLERLDYGSSWFFPDTAYNIAILKSIVSVGYPSISLHGTPLTAYHVLTHYLDALIARLTGVDIFESYPMVITIKGSLYISAVLICFAKLVERYGLVTLLCAVGLGLPVALNTWNPVRSHALWLPSLILTLAMPFVIDSLYKRELPTWPQIFGLSSLCVVVGLGKVSSGFMLACLIGCWLAVKAPFARKTVVFGSVVLLFFYVYGQLFIGEEHQIGDRFSTDGLEVWKLLAFYAGESTVQIPFWGAVFAPNVAILFGLYVLFAMMFRKPAAVQLAAATGGAMLFLWVVTTVHKGLSPWDVGFFIYGLYFPLVFIGVVVIADLFVSFRRESTSPVMRRAVTMLMITSTLFFVDRLYTSAYTLFNLPLSLPKIMDAPTRMLAPINAVLPPDHQLRFLDSRATKRAKLSSLEGPLAVFGQSLQQQMLERGVSARESALFIPQEIFDNELAPRLAAHGGWQYAHGFLAYALWGVPLVNGAPEVSSRYGLATYAKTGKIIRREEFDLKAACAVSGAKVIWEVDRLSPPQIHAQVCQR
ncbi:hypothetical protein GF108_00020 [Phyllobacterium sp. SYP-B3895]|uniref:hypothetical protein n=1 Tax=Phyllobacterium sp. SYP-B3895 TaxID=2663240 RepID=UPI00129964C5|nr:hypothetical protein [Phyllobacterium sp. SYP-B3895]MRG53970.1 hypothetical protein [Phyllobacterium sp. SYP-B3895]